MTNVASVDNRIEPTAQGKVKHLAYLDSIRAIAAIYVVMHHAQRTIYSPTLRLHGTERLLVNWASGGHWSVCIFIVLSGFCLMLPVLKSDGTLRGGVSRYFYRRSIRILPPYYAALFISLALALSLLKHNTGAIWDNALPVTWRGIGLHLLLAHDLLPQTEHQINYPLWSVAVEWQIYFAFPLMLWLSKKFGALNTAAISLVLSYMAVGVLRKTSFIGVTPQFYGLFAMGMLAASVAFPGESKRRMSGSASPWYLLSAFSMGLVIAARHFPNGRILDFGVGLAAMALLIAVSHRDSTRARRMLEWRPLVFIGSFSYSLYLVHAPLLQIAWYYGIRRRHISLLSQFILIDTAGVVFAGAVAYLFFLVAERPFLNSSPRAPQDKEQTSNIVPTPTAPVLPQPRSYRD